MSKNRSQNILLAEIMIAVLFFALCSTVILEVFVAARKYSDRAQAHSEALIMAQDLAERLYVSEDVEAVLLEEGFEKQDNVWSAEQGECSLKLTNEEQTTAVGVTRIVTINLWMQDKLLAELPVVRYIPGGVSE